MNRIGIWGDSITWGAWDFEMGGWVARLRHFIENYHQAERQVYNMGIDGDKLQDVAKRFDAEYAAREPEIIIFAVGINDSPHDSHPDGTMLNEFEKSYSDLVAKVKGKAKQIVIVSPTNVDDEQESSFTNAGIKPYVEATKKVAASHQLTFVDVFGLIEKKDLQYDGLHPETGGHEKIFQEVSKALGYK